MPAVEASYLYDINTIQLGGPGAIGPQPGILLSGGGALAASGGNTSSARTGTLTLAGGGALAASGDREATAALTHTGGGALTFQPVTGLLVTCTEVLIGPLPLRLGVAPTPAPAGLILTLVETALDLAPGVLVAFIANGTPGGTCVLTIERAGTPYGSLKTDFDESGAVGGISVPVVVPAIGTYNLVATDITAALSATAVFTVAAINTPTTIGAPVTTPPTNVQASVGVKKWVFQDPATSDVYHFAISPNKMNSPFPPKRITFTATTAIDGNKLAFEGQSQPVEWQFSGVLFDKAQYDAFVTWIAKRNRIWITDHWGRAWLCYLTHFDPQPRRDVAHPWCHDWTMTALIFEGPVNPT